MIRRLVVSGGSQLIELALRGTVVVGRDPACEVSESSDPLLSRRHAEISIVGKDVVVRDLGSRNGILVNGSKTPQSVLRARDVVQIGHLQVELFEDAGLLLETDAETIAATPTATAGDDTTALIDRASIAATLLVGGGAADDATIARDSGTRVDGTIVAGHAPLTAPAFNDDDDRTLPSKRVGR